MLTRQVDGIQALGGREGRLDQPSQGIGVYVPSDHLSTQITPPCEEIYPFVGCSPKSDEAPMRLRLPLILPPAKKHESA